MENKEKKFGFQELLVFLKEFDKEIKEDIDCLAILIRATQCVSEIIGVPFTALEEVEKK